jgi:pimeloyl-ACP methyl ester carboxylesterase
MIVSVLHRHGQTLLVLCLLSSTVPAEDGLPAYTYEDRKRLLIVRDADGTESAVKTTKDWERRRAHIVAHLETAMGPLPGDAWRIPLDVRINASADAGEYVRHHLTYAADPGDRVPAFLLVPKDLMSRAPAMLCLHQTTRIGKDEPAGLGGSKNLHYAHELAERGYICLVPDYPSLGEYKYNFQQPPLPYQSGSMKAIWNNIRGVDLLAARNDVDPDRISVIGHSLGGHNAIFTAVFELRLRAVITSCGFTAAPEYQPGELAGWTGERYMPLVGTKFGNDPRRLPFDFRGLVAALAPRPFFTNSPLQDAFEPEGVRLVLAAAADVYDLHDARDRVHAQYPECDHDFPAAQREKAYLWLKDVIKP